MLENKGDGHKEYQEDNRSKKQFNEHSNNYNKKVSV
jgi:hypothetical protein